MERSCIGIDLPTGIIGQVLLWFQVFPKLLHRSLNCWTRTILPKFRRITTDVSGCQLGQSGTPYLSSVHIDHRSALDAPPWRLRTDAERPTLMSFGASRYGKPVASRLREFLMTKCTEYGNATCRLLACNGVDWAVVTKPLTEAAD